MRKTQRLFREEYFMAGKRRKKEKTEKAVGKPSILLGTLFWQIALFMVILVFVLLSVLTLGREIRGKYEDQQKAQLGVKSAMIDAVLDERSTDVFGLSLYIAGVSDIQSLDPVKNWSARYQILQEMISIANKSTSVGYLFVRKENGFYLGKSSDINYYKYINVHEKVIDRVLNENKEAGQRHWLLMSSEGVDYLIYYIYYPYIDLYIGMVNRVDVIYKDFLTVASGYEGHVVIEDLYGKSTALRESEEKGTDFRFMEAGGDLCISGSIYDREIDRIVQKTIRRTAMIGAAGLLLMLLYLVYIYRSFITKILRLSGELNPADEKIENISITCDGDTQEIYEIQTSAKHLVQEVVASRIQEYERRIQSDTLELLTLRSQIRPHFYLNAITTIDSLNYRGKKEEISQFLQSLAVHIRYMLRTDLSEIRISDEVEHIDAYIRMQEIRYPGQVVSFIQVDPEIQNYTVPHLILYTVIENVFKYAMRGEDTLMIMFTAEKTEEGMTILIEDNGDGFPERVLEQFQNPNLEKSDQHIGLLNVRKTLRLLYGRRDLLKLYNHEPHGSSVEIRIPRQVSRESSADKG